MPNQTDGSAPLRIDLLSLQPNELETSLLAAVFKKEKQPGIDHSGSVLRKGFRYKIELNNKEYEIHLSHDVIFRSKEKFGLYCEVIDNKYLARGCFGELRSILTILSVDEDCYPVKQKEKDPQEWLVKIQSTSLVGQEAEIMQLVPHLHSKPLIVDEFTKKSYIVMWKLPGKNLFETLQSESLSTDQKIQLSLELFLALKSQVHNLDLVHGDIKTENIMVSFDSKTSAPIVDMIDYGSSSRKEDRQSRKFLPYFVGFCETAESEPYTQASDIFSLGKILYQIFCKPDRSNFKIKEEDLKNLTINHQHKLQKLIKSTFASDPESRPTIDALISEIEAIQNKMTRSSGKTVRFSSSFFQLVGLIAPEDGHGFSRQQISSNSESFTPIISKK